jgi:multidrug efflux system membrane fusion protein
VQTSDGETYAWVVRDGKVERRSVRVEAAVDGRVPVTEGLAAGEIVVVDPPRRLRDGAVVELEAS